MPVGNVMDEHNALRGRKHNGDNYVGKEKLKKEKKLYRK